MGSRFLSSKDGCCVPSLWTQKDFVAASTRVWQKRHYVNPEANHRTSHTSLLWLPREACPRPQLPGCGDDPRWASTERQPEVANVGVLTSNLAAVQLTASISFQTQEDTPRCFLPPGQHANLSLQTSQLSLDCVAEKSCLWWASPRPLIPGLCVMKWLLCKALFRGQFLCNNSMWKGWTC